MCQSVAEGGVRCDAHLKTTSALFDYATATVPASLVSEDEMKKVWSGLRKGYKTATAPTKEQYEEFLEKEMFRVEFTSALTEEQREQLLKKLEGASDQNIPTGPGFATQQEFITRVRSLAGQRAKQAARLKAIRKAEESKTDTGTLPSDQPQATTVSVPRGEMVEAWQNDEEYAAWPIPQANDLDKVASVVDSISNDATTASSIGEAIEVGDRQGSYYANAAGYLGLVEKHEDDLGSTHYALTQLGQTFANSSPAERATLMAELVNRTPLARSYRENPDVEALQKDIASGGDGGYSDTVAKRRTSTLTTWISSVANTEQLSNQISTQQRETYQRSIAASMKQRAETAEKRRQASAHRATGETCTSCFMIKPVTNVCPICD